MVCPGARNRFAFLSIGAAIPGIARLRAAGDEADRATYPEQFARGRHECHRGRNVDETGASILRLTLRS